MDLMRGVHVMLETFHADNKRLEMLHAQRAVPDKPTAGNGQDI